MGETKSSAASMPAKMQAPVFARIEEGDFIDSL
jgi:hypothetical protein